MTSSSALDVSMGGDQRSDISHLAATEIIKTCTRRSPPLPQPDQLSSFGYTFPLAFGPPGATGSSGWYASSAQHTYDPCNISISPDKPYFKYVFDKNDGDIYEYLFIASRAVEPVSYDLSIDGFDPYWLTPTGGRPDEDITYESICTMSCEGAGGALQ
jgi:hypothetical protein